MCEIAEVYEVTPRKARKEHKCAACNGAITIGEIYQYHHGVSDGRGFSKHVCTECNDMVKEINLELNAYEMISVEELCEAVFEGGEIEMEKRFVANKKNRGCAIPDWMIGRIHICIYCGQCDAESSQLAISGQLNWLHKECQIIA